MDKPAPKRSKWLYVVLAVVIAYAVYEGLDYVDDFIIAFIRKH